MNPHLSDAVIVSLYWDCDECAVSKISTEGNILLNKEIQTVELMGVYTVESIRNCERGL